MHKSILFCLFSAALTPIYAQNAEIGATAGFGVTAGEDIGRSFTSGGGASLKWIPGLHGLGMDYFYANSRRGGVNNRHFVTGSYVVQQRAGTTRPFFQVGVGILRQTAKNPFDGPASGDTDFALTLGAGAAIYVRPSIAIRPELRTYWFVGPSISLVPTVTVAWRF